MCISRGKISVGFCEIRGECLIKESAYTYSGVPAPQYNDTIMRFLMVGDTSNYPHVREVTYRDVEGGRQVEFTICSKCQCGYDAELARISGLREDEFQTELASDSLDIPALSFVQL